MFQTFFYQPILNLLVFLYNVIPGHDFGVAIVLLTVIVKLVLFPFAQAAIKSQKAMQELQPKLNEIKQKYANDKEKMSKEMLLLYQGNKVNPFSSCLPLIVQMPFLFAVFKVFSAELNHQSLGLVYGFISRPEYINTISLGMFDLSASKNIILALLVGGAQFWQGKMMISKRPEVKGEGAKDEDLTAIMNKQMLYMMPVMIAFFSYSFPAGLAFYWLINTLLTGLQQYIVLKKHKQNEGTVVNQ